MSNYSGRHGPNVSQYLRDLNTISPQDTTGAEENFMEEDLSLFTNTQFFDFDSGQNTDFQAQPVKEAAPSKDASAAPSVMGDMPNLDFMSSKFYFLTRYVAASSCPCPSTTCRHTEPFPIGLACTV